MNPHKSIGITFFLLGIVSLLLGIGSVLIAFSLGAAVNQIGMMQGGAETAAGLQTMLVISWVFGMLELLLGISSLFSSIMLFRKKDEKPARKRPRKKR